MWKGFSKQNAIKNCLYNFWNWRHWIFSYALGLKLTTCTRQNLTTKIAKFYHWIRDEHFCILSMIIKFLTILNQEYVFTLLELKFNSVLIFAHCCCQYFFIYGTWKHFFSQYNMLALDKYNNNRFEHVCNWIRLSFWGFTHWVFLLRLCLNSNVVIVSCKS
jgi:hypothetical protein